MISTQSRQEVTYKIFNELSDSIKLQIENTPVRP